MRKNIEEPIKKGVGPVVSYMIHCVIGIAVILCLSFLFSVFISSGKVPESFMAGCAYISVFIGTAVASNLSARKFGRGVLSSLLQGFILLLIIYIIGSAVFGRLVPTEALPEIILACFCGALIGAVLSALGKRKGKRRKHSR